MARLREELARQEVPQLRVIAGWIQFKDDPALPAEPQELNLDGYFEFPPHGIPVKPYDQAPPGLERGFRGGIYDYDRTVEAAVDELVTGKGARRFRGVMAGWDNTARRGDSASIFHGATPANFRRWLRATIRHARAAGGDSETAVFINAWNEWAEGTYLEPDRDYGHGWLEAVASAAEIDLFDHQSEIRRDPERLRERKAASSISARRSWHLTSSG
jgi:hypothetical protein